MEPLIKLRLLGSQLKQHELQYFVQKVFDTFGMDIILSFIFNHFLMKYKQNMEHNNDLQTITSLISSILNERKHKKSNKKKDIKQNDNNKPIFSLNTIPSEIIGECASYLHTKEYFEFSKSNRKIYIAVNSPCKLQLLRTYNFNKKYYECDLNRFRSLKMLGLVPKDLNKYIELHPKENKFNQLNVLSLYNKISNNNEHINKFMNTNYINFNNISYLHCVGFGSGTYDTELYDFSSFVNNILMKFPNIIGFSFDFVYLTDFNDENENISKLFPKLSMISVGNNVKDSVLLLRNKLLNIHSNNIISLHYNESRMEINVKSLPKLKEFWVVQPNIDSLHKIIQNAPDLERFHAELFESQYDDTKLKGTINTVFKTCNKLRRFYVSVKFCQMQKIVKFIEMSLLNANEIVGKCLTIVFSIVDSNIEMDEMNVSISHIINALDTSNINDFMVGIHISEENKTFEDTLKIFKNKFLATLCETSYSIIISNNNCKINGYSQTWLNKAV